MNDPQQHQQHQQQQQQQPPNNQKRKLTTEPHQSSSSPTQKRFKSLTTTSVTTTTANLHIESNNDDFTPPPSPFLSLIQQLKNNNNNNNTENHQSSSQSSSSSLINGYETLNDIWKRTLFLMSRIEDEFHLHNSPTSVGELGNKGKKPAHANHMKECVEMHKMIYDLCINPESNFFEAQLYELYSAYLSHFLSRKILPFLQWQKWCNTPYTTKQALSDDHHSGSGSSGGITCDVELSSLSSSSSSSSRLLYSVVHVWHRYKTILVAFCAKLFSYLENFYVRNESRRNLRDQGSFLFKQIVFNDGVDNKTGENGDENDENMANDENGEKMTMKKLLRQILLQELRKDRSMMVAVHVDSGNSSNRGFGSIDRFLLRDCINLFVDMGMGRMEVFERELIQFIEMETRQFYRKLSSDWSLQYSLTEYLTRVESVLMEESKRLHQMLLPSIGDKLLNICYVEMLSLSSSSSSSPSSLVNDRKSVVLMDSNSTVIELLIENEKYEDLARLYRLLSRIEGELNPLSELLNQYISRVGQDIVTRAQERISKISTSQNSGSSSQNSSTDSGSGMSEGDMSNQSNNSASGSSNSSGNSLITTPFIVKTLIEHYVIEMLQFHGRMSELVNGPFKSNMIFLKTLSDSFKPFVDTSFLVNSETSTRIKGAQLLSFYCDELLRRKDEKLEDAIERAITFVLSSSDRDLFFEEYRKQLAQRLLSWSSWSATDERSIISKMKLRFRGVGDLYRLEKMLADKELSSELKTNFDQYLDERQVAMPLDLGVSVLTMGSWPITVSAPIRLPVELQNAQNVFLQFYNEKFQRRALKWAYTKGFVVLEALFSSGTKLLELTTYQSCVLLMYNRFNNDSNGSLSVAEMVEETGIELNEIQHAVVSLSTKSCRLLCLTNGDKSKSKPLPASTFSLNENFQHKLHKIKVPSVRITEEEVQTSQETVSQDRICIVDAAIVRTMKARKTIAMNQLISEVIGQMKSRFSTDSKLIKKRIESLMEREYIQRSSDGQTLEYNA